MKTLGRLAGAGISGLALSLCFEPFHQNWIVWGWLWLLLPILWTTKSKRPRLAGFGLAYVSGLCFWLVNLKWLWTVTGVGAVSIAMYLALYFGAFGAFAAVAGNPWRRKYVATETIGARLREMLRSLSYAAMLGGLWCGLEWVRGWMLTGFGWNGLGVAFSDNLILAQNAEFVGVIGLSFLPVFFSVVVVQVALRFYQQSMSRAVKLLHWDFACALLVIMVSFIVGTVLFTTNSQRETITGRALLIQQDIPQVAGNIEWEPNRIIDGFVELTQQSIADADAKAVELLKNAEEGVPVVMPHPDLVIWPEACLPEWFSVEEDGSLFGGPMLESIIDHTMSFGNFTLITGINEVEGRPSDPESAVYNSLMIQDQGQKRQSFRKHHLVYFGETIPDIQFLHDLYKDAAGVDFGSGLTAGQSFEPLEVLLKKQKIGVIPSVCFEDTVPRLSRKFVRPEPQIMVNVTNDGWFHKSEGSAQHFQNALFRSIELRRPMLRCANRGMTGIVSITGSTVDPVTKEDRRLLGPDGSLFHRGGLLASFYVPTSGQVTLYARFGDWFAVLGLIIAIVWGAAVRLRKS